MITPAERLKAVFDQAAEIAPPADRAAFLDEACGGDADLRARVEALLRAHAEAGSFLEHPAAGRDGTATYEPGGGAVETALQSPPEPVGALIGPYKLLQQIGEGGMGTVYMAEQTHPVRRLVALKVIKPGMDSRQVVARFEAERQALALMDHVNIARVFDGGTTDAGLPYFVMELVKGVPITRYCDDNNLTPRQRLELFVSVCQAVQHAHQKGVIHRDLKPSNVLVAPYDGRPVVKVIDFGVAKAAGQPLTEKTLFTGLGAVVGTPEYMSPEQAELNNADVDTRSDVFSLGVLLYELLTGSTPLTHERLKQAALLEVLRLVREEEPPRPSTRLSTAEGLPSIAACRGLEPKKLSGVVRGELDWIVMRALEKDRNRRYETANGFAADVQRYLADEPVQACPPSAAYRLRKFARRNRGPVLAASLLVLTLVGGIIGTTWGLIRATDSHVDAVREAGEKETALTAARESERVAQDQLFLALWNQARAGRFSRQMGQRLDSLNALAKAARIRPDERLRDEAVAALALPDVRRHGTSWNASPAGQTGGIAFDGPYRVYARGEGPGIISVRNVSDDREVRRIVSSPGTQGMFWLSPDGRFLARVEEQDKVRVWRVADGEPVLREEPRQTCGWAFSPDSRYLAVGQEGWVLRFDLTTGQEVNRWRVPAPAKAQALAFHPDNRRLAVGCSGSEVAAVFDATDGTMLAELSAGPIGTVAWHPDGRRLAVSGLNAQSIQIWDATARRKLATLEGHSRMVTVLSFHPGGDLLASNSEEAVVRVWDPSSGRQLMQLPFLVHLQFSSDGRWLGAELHGEQAQLLSVTPSREYRTLVSDVGAGQGDYYFGAISPDGRLLAAGMGDGARLWHLASGRQVAKLPGFTRNVFFDHVGAGWELLTDGADGLLRWPAAGDGPAGQQLRLGPPRQLSPLPRAEFARGPKGRAQGAVYEQSKPIQLMDLERDVVRQTLGIHAKGDGPHAVSPDGRWVASCGWHSHLVRVWNAHTGHLAHEWNLGIGASVFFTPDGRALFISRGNEFSFWDVDTWQPTRRLRCDVTGYPGYVAFSPDGRLMALEIVPAVIHLQDVATGRTVARLEDPHGDRARWIGFTPDGTQLVTLSTYGRAVHVWDLRLVRERLKPIGLDWDWDEFRPADPESDAAGPPKVEVLLGHLAKPGLTPEQRARQALARCRLAFEANPDDAKTCNNLAWVYVTGPEGLRDVNAALPLGEKAVRLEPGNAVYRSTLGVAYYRAARYREAADALRPNLENQENWALAFDLYFLAMSHHRLGEATRARDYYDWAVRWPRTHPKLSPGHHEELDRFRAEAADLLGIGKKRD